MELSPTGRAKLDALLNCTGYSCQRQNCILYDRENNRCGYKDFMKILEFRADEQLGHIKPTYVEEIKNAD